MYTKTTHIVYGMHSIPLSVHRYSLICERYNKNYEGTTVISHSLVVFYKS